MALSFAELLTSAATSTSSITTASVTPGANRLELLVVSIRNGNSINPTAPTISGNGLTWVQIGNGNFDNSSTSRRTVYLFRSMGASPTTGAITITLGEIETDVCYLLDEVSGVDTSGTNGSGAIVQSLAGVDLSGTATSLTITLPSGITAGNAVYGAFGTDGSMIPTAGSGLTLLGNVASASNESAQSEYKIVGQTTVNMTFGGTVGVGGIAVEIKAAGGAAAPNSGFLAFM